MQAEDRMDLARDLLRAYAAGLRAGVTHTEVLHENHHERDYIGLSQAGKCMRQVALSMYPGVSKSPTEVSTLEAFHVGNLLEMDVRAILKAGGVHVQKVGWEIWGQDIRGHIDGTLRLMVDTPDDGPPDSYVLDVGEPGFGAGVLFENALLEIKSMRAYPFQRLIGKAGSRNVDPPLNVVAELEAGYILEPGTLKKENLLNYYQIQAYMRGIQSHIKLPCAVYLGRDRDSGKIAIEVLEYDEVTADAALLNLTQVALSLKDRMVPPRRWAGGDLDPDDKKLWMCQEKYCPVRAACVGLGGAEDNNGQEFIPAPETFGIWKGAKS